MPKSCNIRYQRLKHLENEFENSLAPILRASAQGRYGLFGQNDHLDPEKRYWSWTEAERLVQVAEEIRALHLEFGSSNPRCDRLLEFRGLRGSNVPGEPKLASTLMAEFGLE